MPMSTKIDLIEAISETVKQGLKLLLLGDDSDGPPKSQQTESNQKPAE